MASASEIVKAVRAARPAEGLFAEKEWLISPEPFPLSEQCVDELEKLGYRLNLFQRACNQLYQQSVKGSQPRWVADYLDRGKPPDLVALARERSLRDELSRVIRPDLVLTEAGFVIAEIDSVPGGIGLTAWLNETYSQLGFEVIGGATGMLDGFRSITGGADIVISEESATYRPEMEWLGSRTGNRVRDAASYQPNGAPIYRFFEMFDLPNIASGPALLNAIRNDAIRITPPPKAYLEEKMWFALFWMRPLRDFWRRELTERHWLKLQEVIPYTWIVDPAPLPQHAVIPNLEVHDWRELGHFSQKARELVLKISGFSELAWGSRGVSVAADMPQKEWQAALENALARFETQPFILQRFHKGRLFSHPFADPMTGELRTMEGRVRLCPYYFIIEGKAELRGALATICPPDKKLLHGMRDAILTPAGVAAGRQA
jgi:hypothetical protein